MTQQHRGPSLEEFLKAEGLYDDAVAIATQRVEAWKREQSRTVSGSRDTQTVTDQPTLRRIEDPRESSS